MAETVKIDLRHVARGLSKVSLTQVQAVVELLDDGNTVPFITRYRKDRTGGLDEEAIRHIQVNLVKMRALNDRKNQILRSLETRGKLTPELTEQIAACGTTKRLEDLYLPYRPKKTTLATAAKTRGLEPLAGEILRGADSCADLDTRAADYVNPDGGVAHAADALLGAGHVIAEWFSENLELRQKLRNLLGRSVKIVSAPASDDMIPDVSEKKAETADAKPKVDSVEKPAQESAKPAVEPAPSAASEDKAAEDKAAGEEGAEEAVAQEASESVEREVATEGSAESVSSGGDEDKDSPSTESPSTESPSSEAPSDEAPTSETNTSAAPSESTEEGTAKAVESTSPDQDGEKVESKPEEAVTDSGAGTKPEGEVAAETNASAPAAPKPASSASDVPPVQPVEAEVKEPKEPSKTDSATAAPAGSAAEVAISAGVEEKPKKKKVAKAKAHAQKVSKSQLRKQRAREKRVKAFSDYFGFSEEVGKIPPHRVLALNRGERAKVLRVHLEYDLAGFEQAAESVVIPEEHPHKEFLRGCAKDSLARLLLPSLERELRRELTEKAEDHAVKVFAKNLRGLLVQPPVHGRRVLAIDPGFRNGCKLVALDQFGNVLGHDLIFLVGKTHRLSKAKKIVKDLIDRFQLTVVAIGNGSGCRETEEFVSKLISEAYSDQEIAYVIVNGAGASVYSISRTGREEFPSYEATLRSAISIGRRLQDPLSELVKIDPGSIGVGLYQHDVKAKHLRSSLDNVVESSVNFVGVDVNMASPALLRYVSGLNQLTARHIYEYRRQNGPFRNRAELQKVQGVGEQTFTQAAGFLRITSGDQPLDATWIHPESYPVAEKLLAKIDAVPADVLDKNKLSELKQRLKELDTKTVAEELEVGEWTLRDLVSQLTRPGRDPREDLPSPVFKRGVLKIEDLEPGMELSGTVLNVVDFGVFVDIGLHDSGLVHVSHLADKFVRDPHDVVAVGNIVKVWVLEIDKDRRRVSLSMIPPRFKTIRFKTARCTAIWFTPGRTAPKGRTISSQ